MDAVERFLFEDLDIRGALVRLGPAWRQMHAGRGYADAARDLLGELTAVTALIGCNLKTPGRLTFHLRGHGPVRLLVVDCDERLRIRGLAKRTITLLVRDSSACFEADRRLRSGLGDELCRACGAAWVRVIVDTTS